MDFCQAGAGKPDPRMFQLCEAKSGYAAEELVGEAEFGGGSSKSQDP